MEHQLEVKAATRHDVPILLEMIRQLAEYEKLLHEVVATEADLERSLFGKDVSAEAVVGYHKGEPVGFALFFQSYATFTGRPGLYLEDLFVRPEARGKGFGKALLMHLAAIAQERNYARFEWAVINWNTPAIEFYEHLGAKSMKEWMTYRVDGEALERLASGG